MMVRSSVWLPLLVLTGFEFLTSISQTEFNFTFSSTSLFLDDINNTLLSPTQTETDIDTTEPIATANREPCGSALTQCNIPGYWNGDYGEPQCSQWYNLTWYNMSSKGNVSGTSQYDDQFQKNKKNRFRTVMWFQDTIWSGTLADYQKILQQSFTYAIIDLHDKWGKTNNNTRSIDDGSITVNDVYVNVTFFLGFCLLDSADCDVLKEEDLEKLDDEGLIAGERDNIPYYVYANIFSTEEKYKYVHELLDLFKEDYMAFASMRMQCDNFTDLLGVESKEDTAELAYEGHAYYVAELVPVVPWDVPDILNWSVLGFVGLCFLFAISGAIHGFVVWKADCIRISGIIYFGLYTWDFYSDIVFTLSLWDSYEREVTDVTLFYAAAAFVIIPWLANMVALSRYQNKWCKDETIRERVYQWFVSWQRLTYALAALSGSAFGTVELANSYVFGLDFFCMGLNERHLKKFNNNRLYSSILVENAPQICIQVIYLAQVVEDIEDLTDEDIALAALAASVISVGAALLDIYASKKLFSVLKKDGEYVGKTSCSIFVISSEIKQNATRLQISTYAFRDAIAETLSTHPRSVEMHFPIATSTGFKMKFTIFSSKLTPEVIYKAIKNGAETKLPKRIQQQWRLLKPVAIPTDRIEVERVENENDAEEGLSAPLNNNNNNGINGGDKMLQTTIDTNDPNNIEQAIQLGSQSNLGGNGNNNQETNEDPIEAVPIRKGRLSRAGEKS